MELRIVADDGSDAAAPADGHGGGGPKAPLGRLLVDAGLATAEQVQAAAAESSRSGERFGEVLLRHGIVSEGDLGRLLAEQWGLPFVEQADTAEDAPGLLSLEDARALQALPLRLDDGRAVVGVADPSAERLDRLVRLLGGTEVSLVVVTPSALARGLAGRSEPVPPARAEGPESQGAAAGVADALAGLEGARAELRAVAGRLERTGQALQAAAAAAAATESALAERGRQLDSATAAAEREAARASELQALLARRDEFVAALGTKLSELTRTVQAGARGEGG